MMMRHTNAVVVIMITMAVLGLVLLADATVMAISAANSMSVNDFGFGVTLSSNFQQHDLDNHLLRQGRFSRTTSASMSSSIGDETKKLYQPAKKTKASNIYRHEHHEHKSLATTAFCGGVWTRPCGTSRKNNNSNNRMLLQLRQIRGGGGASTASASNQASSSTTTPMFAAPILHALYKFRTYLQASKRRCWMLLVVCVLLDTGSTVLMKSVMTTTTTTMSSSSNHHHKLPRIACAFTGYFLSLSGLAVALHTIDVSIAYAVWAALGTAIVSTAGILLFGERCNATKLVCLLMIVGGVVGLELSDRHS